LEKIRFKNAHFRHTQNRLFNREYLADEVRNEIILNEKDLLTYDSDYIHQVEILYRQLKVNFEEQRDYARAGEFHYGEMEMQRKWKMLGFEGTRISRFLPF